jgi:hypothetical protein
MFSRQADDQPANEPLIVSVDLSDFLFERFLVGSLVD